MPEGKILKGVPITNEAGKAIELGEFPDDGALAILFSENN